MKARINVYKQVEDGLAELSRGNKKDHLSAEKARSIIRTLAETPGLCLHEAGSTTNFGEGRFANCVKFDLGCGHRMVCLKDGKALHFVFLGTHDAADRWLEINRGSGPERLGKPARVIEVRESDDPEGRGETDGPAAAEGEDADYDEILLSRITEKDLRVVFAGLCGEQSRRPLAAQGKKP